MTNEIRMTKSEEVTDSNAFSDLGLHSSFVIRDLSFWCIALLLWLAGGFSSRGAEVIESDVCVYGGTVAGAAAGVQAARMGKSVVIAEFGNHVGGMTSGGLGATDIGNKAAIGGISREFYHRVALHYARDEAWKFETRDDYFKNRSKRPGNTDLSAPDATMWTFEPHVAEDILFQMLNEAKVPVYLQQRLAEVEKKGKRVTALRMENGKVFRAKMFIDASYEGDLMAKAGVSYAVGREANSQYDETLNGIRASTPKHQFKAMVDPYVKPGDASSGLIAFIQSVAPGTAGEKDASVQAYNFRLCYTRTAANRLPNLPPPDYNPAQFELLARYLEALVAAGKNPILEELWNPLWMPNGKTDINNNGGFSTDHIGANYEYPDGSYAKRADIWRAHENYIKGFVYFLATSPRVPENIRQEMQTWGPAKDEFMDTDHWPHQLYVREARRMVSDYVMTEANCRGTIKAEDAAGLAAYTMDSHNCRRIVRDGHAENEGDVQVGGFPPYPISYRAIIPKATECENLLVPICLSATHISYGSIRMEPVFMILGQSAATAAVLAIDENRSLQQLEYARLRKRLEADGQVLQWSAKR
jgi:FAD dependent oxidoreductase